MKFAADRLAGHLARGLAPVYLLSGDDPLLMGEAADRVRGQARKDGFAERTLHVAERGFDWSLLSAATANLSLFAEKTFTELRLPTGKIGVEGSKAIVDYTRDIAPDSLLLIVSAALTGPTGRAKWISAVERAGVHAQVWPVKSEQMIPWVTARMRAEKLSPDAEAAAIIAERAEGNLLAVTQEIEKLLLLHGEGPVDGETCARIVASNARFDVYQLADAALAGNCARALRVLAGLKAEGTEPTFVLWAVAREIRTLASLSWQVAHGRSPAAAMGQMRPPVWRSRQGLMGRALSRYSRPRVAQELLRQAAHTDRVIKGAADGDPWDEITALVSRMAGVPVAVAS